MPSLPCGKNYLKEILWLGIHIQVQIAPPILEFVRPLSDENSRLVSQGGLFTRGPIGVDIEQWMQKSYPEDHRYFRLFRAGWGRAVASI